MSRYNTDDIPYGELWTFADYICYKLKGVYLPASSERPFGDIPPSSVVTKLREMLLQYPGSTMIQRCIDQIEEQNGHHPPKGTYRGFSGSLTTSK